MSMLLIWSWLYRFTGLVITHQRPSLVWASQTSYCWPRTYSLVSSIHSVHVRVYRAPVTAARLLDGARSVLGYQTRYAAVGCHHGFQVLQPTR